MQPRLLDPRATVGVKLGRPHRLDLAAQSGKIAADRAATASDGDPFPPATLNTPPLSAQ